MPCQNQPDGTYHFPDGDACLYLGESLKYNGKGVVADCMIVQWFTGEKVEVYIYELGGKRLVRSAVTKMISPSGTLQDGVEDIPFPEDKEKHLLAIYDHFTGRTFQH